MNQEHRRVKSFTYYLVVFYEVLLRLIVECSRENKHFGKCEKVHESVIFSLR